MKDKKMIEFSESTIHMYEVKEAHTTKSSYDRVVVTSKFLGMKNADPDNHYVLRTTHDISSNTSIVEILVAPANVLTFGTVTVGFFGSLNDPLSEDEVSAVISSKGQNRKIKGLHALPKIVNAVATSFFTADLNADTLANLLEKARIDFFARKKDMVVFETGLNIDERIVVDYDATFDKIVEEDGLLVVEDNNGFWVVSWD